MPAGRGGFHGRGEGGQRRQRLGRRSALRKLHAAHVAALVCNEGDVELAAGVELAHGAQRLPCAVLHSGCVISCG